MPRGRKSPDPRRLGISHEVRNGQRWAIVNGVPGWEHFDIGFQWHMRDSEPVVTALHLDPISSASAQDLTEFGLQALPIKAIAQAVAHWDWGRYAEAMASMTVEGDENDPRALTTVRRFAEVWLEGYQSGKRPLAHARKALGLSESTAERYARKARGMGLIPETKRSRARGQVADNREERQ